MGKSIIIISHKLWEVKRISGSPYFAAERRFPPSATKDVEEADLAAMMVGKRVSLEYEKTPVTTAQNILELKDVCAKGAHLASLPGNMFPCIFERVKCLALRVWTEMDSWSSQRSLWVCCRPNREASITGRRDYKMPTRKRIEQGICPYSGGANDTGTGRPISVPVKHDHQLL